MEFAKFHRFDARRDTMTAGIALMIDFSMYETSFLFNGLLGSTSEAFNTLV
jgi:hypothetical protein